NALMVGWIFLIGLATAWGLSSTLLRPISRFVDYVTGIPGDGSPLPELPPSLAEVRESGQKQDELYKLIESFQGLMEKVRRGQKLSRAWSYQMAHELKTPLAIAEGEVVQAKKR